MSDVLLVRCNLVLIQVLIVAMYLYSIFEQHWVFPKNEVYQPFELLIVWIFKEKSIMGVLRILHLQGIPRLQ